MYVECISIVYKTRQGTANELSVESVPKQTTQTHKKRITVAATKLT